MNDGKFAQTSDQTSARPRARYACLGCRKSKRRCNGIPNQRECSECRKKGRDCNFSVCPMCLNKNENKINDICDNCLSKSMQQDFDNFQMESEIYNGYEDSISYDDIFTYDASPSSYSSLPQFYNDAYQQIYVNEFLNQNEIHGPGHSSSQVYQNDVFEAGVNNSGGCTI
ncbi:478_t:CDS:2 [Dentiscutata erythropus]|uniref:478_t:CDS:1 n=1 Tax=Dentiscutata erythropus TaxID=1348616 RepID=A0A9N9HEU9_9GLOM|nr:478_t:CDS:2 [Dentiscutata erythropus]